MNAEILPAAPSSGEVDEKYFGEHFNFCLWVKFTDDDHNQWAGCFAKTYDGGFNKVLVDAASSKAFVVACGRGYLIDLNGRNLVLEFEEGDSIESAIATANPNYFIAGGFYSIYVLEFNGTLKCVSPDFILDGIYFKGQLNNKAIGELATAENQYDGNMNFEFDLETFCLTLKGKSITDKKPGVFKRLWKKIAG
jgi:hypothetical protein